MMGKNEMLVLIFCLLVQFIGIHATSFTRSELLQRLTNKTTYDPYYPQGYDEGKTNVVIVQLDILDLTSISEQNMEYTLMMLMRMQWQDERLAFKELANYSRLDLIGERVRLVWTPDLYMLNERKTVAHSFIKAEELIYIDPDGIVTFSKRFSATNYCRMNLMHYPFDVQECVITILSYALTSDEMMLKWTEKTVKAEGVDLPNYQISVANFTDGVLSEEQNSLAGGIFSFLNVTLQLSRMPKAYGSMYFAPYPLFFTVAVTSFGFKDQIGSRIIVCTSGISTSVLQWIAIYSRLPPVWYLTYLDGWIIAHIVIIGILLVYHSVWYMLLHQSRKEQDQFEDLLKEMHAITIDVRDYKTWPEFLEQLSDEAAAKLITAFPEKVDKNKYFKRYKKSRERKHIRNTNNEVSQFADVVKEVQRRTPDMSCCKTLSTLLESEQLSGKARRKLINDPRYMLICNRVREKYYEGYIKRMDSNKFVKAIQKNLVDFWTFVAVMVLYSLIVILFSLWAEFQWRWTLMLLIDAVIVALLLLVFKWSWCRQRMRSFCIKYIKRIRARSPYGSRIPLNEDRKPNYKGIDSTGSEGKDKGECGGSMVGQTSNL